MSIPQIQAAVGVDKRQAAARFRRGAASAEREQRALDLLVSGASYAQIALALGMKSHSAAVALCGRALAKRALELNTRDLDHARALHLDRLSEMYARWLPHAWGDGDLPGDPKAADIVLKTLDRIARVEGTEVPQQQERTMVLVVPEEQRAAVRAQALERLDAIAERRRVIEGEFFTS